ncbi:glycosyltransferase family 9 protein [candidate division KSB1 bacterium]|nr:glycosyltransferase family 9 protein [candidate division KSB1 bacterium]
MKRPSRILLSRTDSIGDVVLTLPMAAVLRQLYPEAKILFLGRSYTQPVLNACENIDEFYNWDTVEDTAADEQARLLRCTNADIILHVFPRPAIARAAKRAHIPLRLGTTNRRFHWGTCNRLIRLSRKRSPLHEAQLNLKLLKPLGAQDLYARDEIAKLYGLRAHKPLPQNWATTLADHKFNLILHPTSAGSALQWSIKSFVKLIDLLPQDKFELFLTGTAADGAVLTELLHKCPSVHDMTGKMNLDELISFIAAADGLLAGSTGPLHLAAALGIHAIGLYPSRRPMHPDRWAPLGYQADYIEDGVTTPYEGDLQISPQVVVQKLLELV